MPSVCVAGCVGRPPACRREVVPFWRLPANGAKRATTAARRPPCRGRAAEEIPRASTSANPFANRFRAGQTGVSRVPGSRRCEIGLHRPAALDRKHATFATCRPGGSRRLLRRSSSVVPRAHSNPRHPRWPPRRVFCSAGVSGLATRCLLTPLLPSQILCATSLACMPARLLACSPACLPARLLACLPACLFACLFAWVCLVICLLFCLFVCLCVCWLVGWLVG